MEAILRNEYTVDWITIILFSSIFFMVLAKTTFYSRFLNYIILPFNNKYIFLYQKKDKLFNWFSIFFSIFQLLNSSLFLYFAYTIFFKIPEGQQFVAYGIIFISLFLFFTIKFCFQGVKSSSFYKPSNGIPHKRYWLDHNVEKSSKIHRQ